MEYALFSIDGVDDTHTLAKFLRHFDTQRALCKTRGPLIHCIGMLDGKLEQSFICHIDDWIEHIVPFGYTKDQEAVITISGPKQECFIGVDFIGCMVEVSKKKAFKSIGFTYRPDQDKYWVIK